MEGNRQFPYQGASVTIGDLLDIDWETDAISYQVEIRLMRENLTILDLGTTTNDGHETWKVPSRLQPASGYYFHINATDNSVFNVSPSFSIKPKLKIIPGYDLTLLMAFFLMPIILACKKYRKK